MCRTCPLLHRTDICGVVQRLPRRVSVPQAQVRFLPPLLMKFTAMKILTLIIKQKWFDAILSGEKTVVHATFAPPLAWQQVNHDPDRPCKRSDCVFMYFVKGLDHIDNYLRAVKARYANVTILQVPHWTLTRVLRCGLYCIPNPNVKLLSLKDVDESVRMKTGISYSFYGMKQSDGMNRCLMLRGYENEAISNTNKVYPLSKWKKSDVMAYIKAKKLPEPISYNKNKSQGLTFLPEVFDYLRRHYPQDLEKIYKVFPLSRNILLRYDEEKRAAAQIQAK